MQSHELGPILGEVSSFGESRILVEDRGSLYHFCRFAWSDSDASLYLFPPEEMDTYFVGTVTLPAGEHEAPYPLDTPVPTEPHLSVHQSGQVHVKVGRKIAAGPIHLKPIAALRGHHVALIHCVRFDRLPRLTGRLREEGGPSSDSVFPTDGMAETGIIRVFVNGEEPVFLDRPRVIITFERDALPTPLYVGLAPIPFRLVDDDGSSGVFISAGWDPTGSPDGDITQIFLAADRRSESDSSG